MTDLTHADRASWLGVIWNALHAHRETTIPEGTPVNDAAWDEITTAMAWVHDELGVDHDEVE